MHQFDAVHARGAKLLRHLHVLTCFPLAITHRPGPGLGRIADLAVLEFQNLLDKGFDIHGRNPHRTQARLDGRWRQVFGLHLFQRVDIAPVGATRHHGLLELRFHVARQIVVGGFPFRICRVQKNLPGFGQRLQHCIFRRGEQASHVNRIDPPPPLDGRRQCLGRFPRRSWFHHPCQRAPREQRRFPGGVRLFVVVLQRQQQGVIRVTPECQCIGPGAQATVFGNEAVIGAVEQSPQVTQPSVVASGQLGIQQDPGVIANRTHAGDPASLCGVELLMHVRHLAALHPMHPPLVEAVAAGAGTGFGGYNDPQRHRFSDQWRVDVRREQSHPFG